MANEAKFAMAAPTPPCSDFRAELLRAEAKQTRDAKQARCPLAVVAIFGGGSRRDAARIGGVGIQIVRDWVLRFNAAVPDGLIDRKAPGAPPKLIDHQRRVLDAQVEK